MNNMQQIFICKFRSSAVNFLSQNSFERVQEFYHSFILYKIANYYDMIYIPPAPSLDTPSRDRRVFR